MYPQHAPLEFYHLLENSKEPLPKILNPITYGGFRHVYMTNCSYFYFQWLKAWGFVIFHWFFDFDGWWLTLHILFWSYELIDGWNFLLWIPFDGMFIVELIWVITYPSESFQVVYPCLPFSPFEGLWFLTFLMILFSQVLCAKMFIRSRTIVHRIFKFISFRLIRFWEHWLFNYPLYLTLYFPTLKLMDLHGTKQVP